MVLFNSDIIAWITIFTIIEDIVLRLKHVFWFAVLLNSTASKY